VFSLAGDDTGSLEDFQVLGNRRLRQPDLIDNVTADAGLLLQQQPHDADARRMAKRLCDQRHAFVAQAETGCGCIRRLQRSQCHHALPFRSSSIGD
jgi:hypothetical protein